MKKRALQAGVVVALVGVALLLRSGGRRLPATPEDTVNALFDAARDGDDRAYLNLTTGDLRKQLDYDRSQQGAEAFGRGLAGTTAGIKGTVVSRAPGAPAGMVALEVELIFADRNETQRMLLAEEDGGWAVASIEAAEMVKPPVPYGTPVFAEPAKAEKPSPETAPADAAKE